MRPHRQQPTRLPRPWDSPGKNTGVGCHFLLQCMKVKSEKWQWNRSVVSNSVWPHRRQSTRFCRPWDFPGKSTRVGYHCLQLLFKKIQKITNIGEVVEKLEPFCAIGGSAKWCDCYGKRIRPFRKKLEIVLPYYQQFLFWLNIPKKLKAGTCQGICIPMFIGTLFTLVKGWKQSK